MKRPASDRRDCTVLLMAVGLITGLRIIALWFNETDLFFDEAQYWFWGQTPALGYYSKPPIIGWVLGGVSAVCGDSAFCIRLPAPIFHAVAAIAVFFLARRLYGSRIGLMAALAYVSLPAVSLGSTLISTDTVLLPFWALALWMLVSQAQAPQGWKPPVLGVMIGLGLLSKYAMAYFILCAISVTLVSRYWRQVIVSRDGAIALIAALLVFAPNLWWNLVQADGVTLRHTIDNANWDGWDFHPVALAEFLGAQAAVIGPVLIAALLWVLWHLFRGGSGIGNADALLLCFSVPILLVVSAQALISRAHANWAATAYVAVVILVVAVLLRWNKRRVLHWNFALNGAVAIPLLVAPAFASRIAPPVGKSPYERVLGWSAALGEVGRILDAAEASGRPYKAVIGAGRKVTAELFYYLRDRRIPLSAFRFDALPGDHFQMVAPMIEPPEEPALIVTRDPDIHVFVERFENVRRVGQIRVASSPGRTRLLYLFEISK